MTTRVNDTIGPDRRFDVAVIGAGLAGLTAAIAANRSGSTTIVLDARSPGGRARSTRRDGFVLNLGAHALYEGGAGARVLGELGIATHGGQPPLSEYATWWDGEIVAMPMTPAALVTTRLLGPRSKVAAGKLLGGLGRAVEQTRSATPVTFDDWLDQRRIRPDLARLMTTAARTSTYAAQPGTLPASSVLTQLHAASAGVTYLHGGWQTLVDSLTEAARSGGSTIVGHAPVTTIERDGADWLAHTNDHVVRAASIVIATGGPAHATELAGQDPGWIEMAGPRLRAACLDIGVETGAAPAPRARYLFSSDDPNYLSCHAPVARLAPAGHALYSLLRYLAPDEELDAATARLDLERHASRAGLPATGQRAVDRFLAPLNVTWGSPVAGRARPQGDELAADGLFVAGDWVGDHMLVDAALDSGLRVGRAATCRRHRAA